MQPFRYLRMEDDIKSMSPEERAVAIQQRIAGSLSLPNLQLSCHDINEHKKTLIREDNTDVDIDSLVRQVVEVLPNIPESEIRVDLSKF